MRAIRSFRALALVPLVQLIAACSPVGVGLQTPGASATSAAPVNSTQPVSQTNTTPVITTQSTSQSIIPGASASAGSAAFVTTTNAAASSAGKSAPINVGVALPVLAASASKLPKGIVGSVYSAQVHASGGANPYAWAVQNGQLPTGLMLAQASGVISGKPTKAETSNFTLRVRDRSGAAAILTDSITINAAAPVAPFGHVVVVVEENENYSSVIGNRAAMPYLNSLMDRYGLATQYYASTHPSIGNYMMLATGQVLTNDDSQTPASFPVSAGNVVRQLSAHGKTWKAYAENLPSVGYTGGNVGNYAVRHVPLAYLTDVQDSGSGKQSLVPFTDFAADLAAGRLPDYAFVTPNLCDDGHNCGLSTADNWLKTHIAPLLTSTPFKNDGLLIIVFDESVSDNYRGGGRTAAVLISPAFSKAGHKSTTVYQHQSTLRLTLEALGIKSLPGAAATAPTMWEFFTFPPPP